MATGDGLWDIVAGQREGILATVEPDGSPQLSNIYYLADAVAGRIFFSTTTDRVKGRNLLRDRRVALHVSGRDFLHFAVVVGTASVDVAREADDDAVEKLFEIHSGLGAVTERDGFGRDMLAAHRMAVEVRVERVYGQILTP